MAKKRAKISSPYNHLKYHFTKSYLNISRFTKEDINRHMRKAYFSFYGCRRWGENQEKINLYKAAEKLENFLRSKERFASLKEVRENRNFKLIWGCLSRVSLRHDGRWWHFPFCDVDVTHVHCEVKLTDSWPECPFLLSCKFKLVCEYSFSSVYYCSVTI